MSKILYIVNNKEDKDYTYDIDEDTIIYHFVIDSSNKVVINIKKGIELYYFYNNINYKDNRLELTVNHLAENSHSEVFNHGVNVFDKSLDYNITGIVPKRYSKCICNQENQIINMNDGKSTICPNLLIDNYDVVSNHSAYIGKFKDDVLFYMMSRGISRDEAYRLLLRGFLINSDSIDLSQIEEFSKEIENI